MEAMLRAAVSGALANGIVGLRAATRDEKIYSML